MARFVKLGGGFYINVDQVTNYIEYEDHLDVTMSDGQGWRVPKKYISDFKGENTVKNLLYIPGTICSFKDIETGEPSEMPVDFIAVLEDGSIRPIDSLEYYVSFADQFADYECTKINGHEINFMRKVD